MFKRALLIVVVGLALAACSDQPLADVGHVTNDWIGRAAEDRAVPATTGTTVPSYESAAEVQWANDPLDSGASNRDEALAAVWDRRRTGDQYVQASRAEIALALPGLQFPNLLPADIAYVSSQLIFDGDGTLADGFVAAFGLWTAEPYSVSRTVGQQAVLWIALPGPSASGCDRFQFREVGECATVSHDGKTAWRLISGGTETLVWLDGDYQYELFHRSGIDRETALRMSEAMIGLAMIEPGPMAAGT